MGFGNGAALYGSQLWLPQIVKAMGFSNLGTGFVIALPYAAGMAAMILWGRSSDRRGERVWHIAIACLVSAAGFAAASLVQSNLLMILALTFAIVGTLAYFGPFFTFPSSFSSGPAAAGGIALVNTFSNFGGFLGPTVIGMIKQRTGEYPSRNAGAGDCAYRIGGDHSSAWVRNGGPQGADRLNAKSRRKGVCHRRMQGMPWSNVGFGSKADIRPRSDQCPLPIT